MGKEFDTSRGVGHPTGMAVVSGRILCAIRDDRSLPSAARLFAIFLVLNSGLSSEELIEEYEKIGRSRRSFWRDLGDLRRRGWVAPGGFVVLCRDLRRRPVFQRAGVTVLLAAALYRSAKLVALMIRLRGGHYDETRYRATLELDTKLGSRTVDRALSELRESGWLVASLDRVG